MDTRKCNLSPHSPAPPDVPSSSPSPLRDAIAEALSCDLPEDEPEDLLAMLDSDAGAAHLLYQATSRVLRSNNRVEDVRETPIELPTWATSLLP